MLVCIVIFWGCPRVRPWNTLSSTCIFAMKSVLAQGACIKLAPNSVRKEQSHLLQVVREGIEKLGLLRDPSKNFFFSFKKLRKGLALCEKVIQDPVYCAVMLAAPGAPSGDPDMLVQQLGSWLRFWMSGTIRSCCRTEEIPQATCNLILLMGAVRFCRHFISFHLLLFVIRGAGSH